MYEIMIFNKLKIVGRSASIRKVLGFRFCELDMESSPLGMESNDHANNTSVRKWRSMEQRKGRSCFAERRVYKCKTTK